MSEFEDKLGAILGNPDAMAQIMALAQNLSQPAASPQPTAPSLAPSPAPDLGFITDGLGSVDPALLQAGMQLFSEFSRADDEKAALLLALKPFLKPERCAKVDRAVQIARLSRMLRVGLRLFKGKGGFDV